MELNPRLESIVERYEPDRLKALLMWFGAESQSTQGQAGRLDALLEETENLDINACYRMLQGLEMDDMVQFAMINEFGPAFSQKPYFSWLAHQVEAQVANR